MLKGAQETISDLIQVFSCDCCGFGFWILDLGTVWNCGFGFCFFPVFGMECVCLLIFYWCLFLDRYLEKVSVLDPLWFFLWLWILDFLGSVLVWGYWVGICVCFPVSIGHFLPFGFSRNHWEHCITSTRSLEKKRERHQRNQKRQRQRNISNQWLRTLNAP